MLHRELDAIQDDSTRLELLLRGVFAGNIFDLGAAASADLFQSSGVGASLHASAEWSLQTARIHPAHPLEHVVLGVEEKADCGLLKMFCSGFTTALP